MGNYIIRRLLGAVVLLFVVSVITFSIFFLVPRLAGASADTLASRYVGRTASSQDISVAAEKLGFYDPFYVQYGRWAKAIFVGAEYDYGPGVEHCPAPCFGYSFLKSAPVWPDLIDRLNVTLSLVVGAAAIWLIAGVSTGIVSALKRGSIFDRLSMGVALAGVSLPIFFTGLISLIVFSYGHPFRITAPGRSFTDFTVNPAGVGVQPDPALDHARLPVRGRIRPTDPGGHAGDHGRGLCTHRAGEGPDRARRWYSSTGCGPRSRRS